MNEPKNEQEIILEIQTLFGFIDELNYYEMLCLTDTCVPSEIEHAFKSMVKRFHPEQLTEPSEEVMEQSLYLILSFKEAFETLKSISSRLKYDVSIKQGQIRIENTQLADNQDQSGNDPSLAAVTENGKKYWTLALEAAENNNYDGALLQVGFALQYEPSNEAFLEFKAKATEEAKKAPKKSGDMYRIRL